MIGAYRKVFRFWWRYDDAFLLHIAATHTQSQYYTSAAFWHQIPNPLFTPLLMTWYGLLHSWLGLNPSAFYCLHLATLALMVVALFTTFRLWLDTAPSFLAAALVIFGAPACSIVTQLMTVHYAFSVLLGALSVLTFSLALRRQRYLLTVISAALYFLAMLAKEIAIPLPVSLLLLPDHTPAGRSRYLAPHLVAAAAYFAWRRMMLGVFLGGYGWSVRPGDYPALLLSLPQKLLASFASDASGMAVLLLVLAAPAAVAALSSRRVILAWVAAFAAAVLPILPVAHEMQRRYALAAWIVAVILFVRGISALRDRAGWKFLSPIFAVCMLLAVIAVNRLEWAKEQRLARQTADEGRFYVTAPSNAWLREPAIPPGAMFHLQWMREDVYHHSGAAWFYDDLFICTHYVSGIHIWQYVPEARRILDITSSLAAIERHACAPRTDARLLADFDYEDGALYWRLGPYTDGSYHFVLGDGAQAFTMPPRDGFRLGAAPGIAFRIRYDSPAGWSTYSPELTFDFGRQRHWHWQR